MKKTTLWAGCLAVLGSGLVGCAGAEPGRTGADLAYVAESTIEARADLYIDPSSSWRPVTADQLGVDVTQAIPVTVDVYGGVAVAWIRRDGAEGDAASRRREDIVALYRVLGHVEGITPISDELDRESVGPIYVPGDEPSAAQIDPSLLSEQPSVDFGELTNFALIDWIDLSSLPTWREAALWRELQENHPGC